MPPRPTPPIDDETFCGAKVDEVDEADENIF
jgi:hypothetical protein